MTEAKEILAYWKERCLLAEKFIEESPCDSDITPEQAKAYRDWQNYLITSDHSPKRVF